MFLSDQGRVSLLEEESIDTMQIAILDVLLFCANMCLLEFHHKSNWVKALPVLGASNTQGIKRLDEH